MVKRRKRLMKGVASLEKQIELHEKKKKQAEELGQRNLVEYYSKEINALTKRKSDREEKAEK